MKAWLFYRSYGNCPPALVAWTDHKELAKAFDEFRCGHIMVKKELLREELRDAYQNYEQLEIINYKLKTAIDGKVGTIFVPMTLQEGFQVEAKSDQMFIDLLGFKAKIPIHIFQPRMREALEFLGYREAQEAPLSFTDRFMGVGDEMDLASCQILRYPIDEFELFVRTHRNTVRRMKPE